MGVYIMSKSTRGISYQKAVSLLKQAYTAFNARDTDAVLQFMHKHVSWPNGWEGGYVHGHDEVRDYWRRQWAAIDPYVEPVSFEELADGRITVHVHQLVKDLEGSILFDGQVKHIYNIENGLIQTMEIQSDVEHQTSNH
jgi:nuclear transport factor 2 (NTF2) superfamily protein